MAGYQQQDNTPEQKKAYHDKAEQAFKDVIATETENKLPKVLSYQMLARLNNTDTNKPLDAVRDCYVNVINESEDDAIKTKARNARFEACRYLFFYYVSIPTPNKVEATKYANIAKDINPDDSFVKAALDHLKTM